MGLISRVSSRTYRYHMDYEEEKSEELEVLESIYAEKFSLARHSETKKVKYFTVEIRAEEDEDEALLARKTQFDTYPLPNFGVEIQFTHPNSYPDEPIIYSLTHITHEDGQDEDILDGKDPHWFQEVNDLIAETIEENMGMALAFTICSNIQEKINELSESLNQERTDKIQKLKTEEEE